MPLFCCFVHKIYFCYFITGVVCPASQLGVRSGEDLNLLCSLENVDRIYRFAILRDNVVILDIDDANGVEDAVPNRNGVEAYINITGAMITMTLRNIVCDLEGSYVISINNGTNSESVVIWITGTLDIDNNKIHQTKTSNMNLPSR